MVECDLAKVEVAGSNPVSRSIFFGGIAKWEGSGLQNHYSPVRIRMPPPVFFISFRQIEWLAWMKGIACRIFELPFLSGSQWRQNEAPLEWPHFDSDRPPPGVSPSEALISTKYRFAISRQRHPE